MSNPFDILVIGGGHAGATHRNAAQIHHLLQIGSHTDPLISLAQPPGLTPNWV